MQACPAAAEVFAPLGRAALPLGSFSKGKTEVAAKLCWKVTVSLEEMLLQIMPQTRWDICLQ